MRTQESSYSQSPSAVYFGEQQITIKGGYQKADGTLFFDSSATWTWKFSIKDTCSAALTVSGNGDNLLYVKSIDTSQ